jgi:hypothetical protein
MKPRHAAAIALWVSRILAVILVAIPLAWRAHLSDAKRLNWILQNPNAFLEYEQKLYSHSVINVVTLSVVGTVYICLVEALAWCLRKIANHATAEFRTDTEAS